MISVAVFVAVFKIANAQPPQTLINYPEIEGTQPVAFGMSLPQLIRYVYLFAVGICGAIALMAILLGAIKYIGAAGNASRIADAKEQIVSAILGVIILLSSYIILYTINPDLVTIGLSLPSVDTRDLQEAGRVANIKCVCRCKFLYMKDSWVRDVSVTTNPITTLWGTSECKEISFGEGWEQCKESCESTVNYGSLLGAQNASICTEGGLVTQLFARFITYSGSNVSTRGCSQPGE